MRWDSASINQPGRTRATRSTPVTSIVLCQGEECWDSLGLIFVCEDGEQDAVHGGSVLEGPHGPGSARDFTEASLDCVGGAHGFALRAGFVAETGEEVVKVVSQAGDCLGVALLPSVGEAPRGGSCPINSTSSWLRVTFSRRGGVSLSRYLALQGGDGIPDVAGLAFEIEKSAIPDIVFCGIGVGLVHDEFPRLVTTDFKLSHYPRAVRAPRRTPDAPSLRELRVIET